MLGTAIIKGFAQVLTFRTHLGRIGPMGQEVSSWAGLAYLHQVGRTCIKGGSRANVRRLPQVA
jgi:hypothetical protein